MFERAIFLLYLQAVAPLISMFRLSVQVPRFWVRFGLVRETSGQLLVGDQPSATIFRVDPDSGDRAVVSGPGRGDGPPLLAA